MNNLIFIFTLILPFVLGGAERTQNLFDGKTLNGWTNRGGSAPEAGWGIEDGCIVRNDKAGDLYTKQSF